MPVSDRSISWLRYSPSLCGLCSTINWWSSVSLGPQETAQEAKQYQYLLCFKGASKLMVTIPFKQSQEAPDSTEFFDTLGCLAKNY